MIGLFGETLQPSLQELFRNEDIDGLFQYYRESGFPNYSRGAYSTRSELDKVIMASTDEYYSDNTHLYRKYPSANGYLFSYFPHWIDVRCGKSSSLRESWDDDDLLRQLIQKTVTFCKKHGEEWTENRIRQNAKVYCAKQCVSNFNPVCARILYDEFAPNGTVYDMSMGWGGRLLGFYASAARRYIGTDPSVKTYIGLHELNRDLTIASRRRKDVIMFNEGSEVFRPEHLCGTVDFCFTSPPYFDTEKYSDEPTQSYLAFPSPKSWVDGFLSKTIENCYYLLKEDGVLAINIADVPKVKVSDVIIEMAESIGFRYLETRQYEISSVSDSSSKKEPIYIFGKGYVQIKTQQTLFQ